MARAIGPCYTDASIARALSISPVEVVKRRMSRDLLALTTADGFLVYPSFQVRDEKVVPQLKTVLEALREGIDDPWAWALWLSSTPPAVDCEAPRPSRLEQLFAGQVSVVVRAARHSAYSWRS